MNTTRYAIFILLRATEQWLRLTREARRHLSDEHVGGALKRFPALKLRYFDAEAFSAECSDIMLIETGNTDAPAFHKYGPRYSYAAVVEHVGFFNRSSLAEAGRRAVLELPHFERSRHSEWHVKPLRYRAENLSYGVLRALWRIGFPLPQRLTNVACGPVPRVLDLIDHFLAVLRKPG